MVGQRSLADSKMLLMVVMMPVHTVIEAVMMVDIQFLLLRVTAPTTTTSHEKMSVSIEVTAAMMTTSQEKMSVSIVVTAAMMTTTMTTASQEKMSVSIVVTAAMTTASQEKMSASIEVTAAMPSQKEKTDSLAVKTTKELLVGRTPDGPLAYGSYSGQSQVTRSLRV